MRAAGPQPARRRSRSPAGRVCRHDPCPESRTVSRRARRTRAGCRMAGPCRGRSPGCGMSRRDTRPPTADPCRPQPARAVGARHQRPRGPQLAAQRDLDADRAVERVVPPCAREGHCNRGRGRRLLATQAGDRRHARLMDDAGVRGRALVGPGSPAARPPARGSAGSSARRHRLPVPELALSVRRVRRAPSGPRSSTCNLASKVFDVPSTTRGERTRCPRSGDSIRMTGERSSKSARSTGGLTITPSPPTDVTARPSRRNATRRTVAKRVRVNTTWVTRERIDKLPPPDSKRRDRSIVATRPRIVSPSKRVPPGTAVVRPARRSTAVGPRRSARIAAAPTPRVRGPARGL